MLQYVINMHYFSVPEKKFPVEGTKSVKKNPHHEV